jgi:sugar lactone lactonase YvrE
MTHRTDYPYVQVDSDHASTLEHSDCCAVDGAPARAKAMQSSVSTRPRLRRLRRALLVLIVTVCVLPVPGATAAPAADVIVLPGASSTEGIAVGRGSTFYAGDIFRGDIFRGDLQHGTAELFIHAPAGRMAGGMKVDIPSALLFVAGGSTGQAYVYDTATGATVATYQLANPAAGTFINDVTVTRQGAWFTDSIQAMLYCVPIGTGGTPGPARNLALSGPAADTSGQFNVNGIAATPDGSTLIVAHTALGKLMTVNPATGNSAVIAGVSVPNVDGILLEAGTLWAVQNFSNQIAQIRLSADLSSGVLEDTIRSPLFEVPTTIARHGDQLAVVNAKFDTGFPPKASRYEVVIVER